ncbi:immunogenic protein MPT64 [Mycobacterium antarcticum]|uniref:esterase n=1 Tax=Mycolicibacterium sp. TUM20983 TaxID=3023369 RepID=UPI00239112AC|nr:esterase [Mycolicibacterium sp. TUM20983]GLP76468.1 immunogenic protein MPT64 [Mycolicibacterium sp. TUM20983]
MRMSTLALAVSAVAVFGWTGVGAAAAAPPKCTDFGGVVDVNQICQIQASDPGYSLNISYPVNYPDTKPVFDYVKETRDGFLNVAKTPDSRTMPYELETTATEFSSAVPPRGTQSVVFKTYQGVGGAHPTTFYKAFNWDQGLRKPITIDTLFREGTAPFPVIFPLVQAEVDKQLGQPVAIAPEVGLDPTKYQNFAITDDSLIFFFSQGDVLPEAGGALQIAIPRGPVDAMIA